MKKVLIAGGAGFIGSFLADKLLNLGYEVRVFDNLDPQVHLVQGTPDYLSKEAEFIKGDVRDYSSLKNAVKGMDIIFHFAAAVGVGQSQYEIKKYVDTNIAGTANLLDIIVNGKVRIEKLIVAASMSSYGEGAYRCSKCGIVYPDGRREEDIAKAKWELFCQGCNLPVSPIPTNEEKFQNCKSIYAITKKVQEDMALNICKTYGIPGVALRFFNVYGPRQSLSNPYTGVIAIFASRLKNDHPPVIYEDGLQTRDFISVHDIVQANILAMTKDEANFESFNVGSGTPFTIRAIAEILAKSYHKDISPQITNKYRKGDIRHCYADISKAKKILGFEPQIPFEKGIRELIEWSEGQEAKDMFVQSANELREKGLI